MKSTSLKILKSLVFEYLADRLMSYGFRPNKRSQYFYWNREDTLSVVHLVFIEHKLDFDTTIDVGIRFHKLEELIECIESNSEGVQTFSMGAELGNISGEQPYRWTFVSESDVQTQGEEMLNTITSVGIPYLKRFGSIATAFNALNDDQHGWLHSPINLVRYKRVLGLAFLMKNYDLYAQVTQTKLRMIEQTIPNDVDEFLSFKERLDEMWVA